MILSLALVALLAFVQVESEYMKVCYYTNWSQYRAAGMKFYPEDTPPQLCTHVIYAFATMRGNKLHPYEWNDESTDWSKGMFERMTDLKKKWPHLKILIAVGGWNFGTAKMTSMLASAANRKEFVDTSIKFLRDRKFDGLDLDFEYPGSRGSPASDVPKFTSLCKELRAGFEKEAAETGNDRLLVTAAVAAGKSTIEAGYEIRPMSEALDFISIMTYDLNGAWNKWTGHNSPLYSRSDETGPNATLNLDWAATYWGDRVVDKKKLNIGLALYGRSLALVNKDNNGLGAPIKGAAPAGPATREPGFWAYFEICKKLKGGYTRKWNDEHKVPYAYGSEGFVHGWVGYDDVQSLELKVDYIKQKGFGGFMIWALDLDDFKGTQCGEGKYPLLQAINNAFDNVRPSSVKPTPTTPFTGKTTPAPTTTTTTPRPTSPGETPKPGEGTCADVCKQGKPPGDYNHPWDITKYCQCYPGGFVEHTCAEGTVWDQINGGCVWPGKGF